MTTCVKESVSGPRTTPKPRFSIVVPTLNAARFVDACLKSIARQNADAEVIVVDGGSKDRTLNIVHYWGLVDVGIRLRILHRPAQGEANAINEGLKAATGDILAWLDADDVYEPGAFDAVAKSSAMWCYGKCRIINEQGEHIRGAITQFKEFWQRRYSYGALKRLCFIAQPAVFWRREAMENVGLLDESERYVMDYDYWLRLGEQYTPAFIGQYLASWRSHPGSETARALLQDIEDARRVAKKYGGGIGADLTYWGTRLGYKAMGAL